MKTITKLGNGHAIPLDRGLMEQIGVRVGSVVQVTVASGSLIVTPVENRMSNETFAPAWTKVRKRYQNLFAKLAKE